MNKIFSIQSVNSDPFLITWDLGRRCNYDCSYCPAHRHDNFSPHASLETLKKTTEFVFDYASMIFSHRLNKDLHISFTGGEPTVNPNFIEFSKFIRFESLKHSQKFKTYLTLTTNGTMSKKTCQSVIENFDYVTVSYHCEAHINLKQQAIERIYDFHSAGMNIKVNVMFHADYFEECKKLCERLRSDGIKFIPRVIGEDPDSPFSQAHRYTEDHKMWFKNFWNIDFTPTSRPCCGGRTFKICSNEGSTETKVVLERNFKDWHCSVNWYFLHIEQQTELIYHHQTCQATLENKRGAIGDLKNTELLLAQYKNYLDTKTMPIIKCPNKLCGCGLCTPKGIDRETLIGSLNTVINNVEIFANE